jgi:hypothetical protein
MTTGSRSLACMGRFPSSCFAFLCLLVRPTGDSSSRPNETVKPPGAAIIKGGRRPSRIPSDLRVTKHSADQNRLPTYSRSSYASQANRRDEPLRMAHLDHVNQRVILVKGGERPARVKGLRHGALHRLDVQQRRRRQPSPLAP